jgi:hypothetical protein
MSGQEFNRDVWPRNRICSTLIVGEFKINLLLDLNTLGFRWFFKVLRKSCVILSEKVFLFGPIRISVQTSLKSMCLHHSISKSIYGSTKLLILARFEILTVMLMVEVVKHLGTLETSTKRHILGP